jgi:hypothetical protein
MLEAAVDKLHAGPLETQPLQVWHAPDRNQRFFYAERLRDAALLPSYHAYGRAICCMEGAGIPSQAQACR